jgi:HEAT repeat protein
MAQIYVSSTFQDLQVHRKAVSTAIRRLGHVDVAMEYYVAEDKRPVARCVRDAAQCDLYLGIFARRYGYCPPGEQRSITELEFRAARTASVPCICFLLTDDAEWPIDFVETGAGAKSLETLLNEIRQHYLCGLFETPDELAAIASASIVRSLELGRAQFDPMREHRLMKTWQSTETIPMERVRAAQALSNMGSARYVAAIKQRLLDANEVNDVASIAHYLAEIQFLAASRRELMPIFFDLLDHEDVRRRVFSVFQLGELGLRGHALEPAIVSALLDKVDDDQPLVRAEVAHTFSKLVPENRQDPSVDRALKRLLQDQNPGVRKRAEEALAAKKL